jgi:DNA polymerase-3 subunit delta
MEQKMLKAELSRGEVRNMYLLYGEERFLVLHYAAAIEKALECTNKDVFGGAVPVCEIIMAAETVPFSASDSKRLLLIRESKLFASGRKDESEKMADYLSEIPPDTVMVFTESEVDRRTRIFKKFAESDCAVECAPLSPPDLIKWVAHLVKEHGKTISSAAANHLLRTVGNNMANLSNETNKLIHYCGDKSEITAQDITEICTPTLESRIFDLTKAMGAGRTSDTLKMYSDMIFLKESPLMILSMIIRQIRIILLCKCHAEKNTANIARELNLRDFIVSEALSQSRRFTKEKLLAALENCLDTDVRIKTGLLDAETGVEMLLVKM